MSQQGKKIKKERWKKFLKTLEEMLGLVGATCEKLNINRWTYYQHRKEDEEFAKEADKIMKQIAVPFVADKLREAVFRGEGWAIKYFLMCKGGKEWRPYQRIEFPRGVKTGIEQKIRTDPILEKAVKFYEEELKKKPGKETRREIKRF